MALSSPTITPPACASCVFGAVSTNLISFRALQIETITLELVPHVTVYQNGNRVTNYDTRTISGTEHIHTSNAQATTYSDPSDITWHYGNAVLTYPTTYVQYGAFEGCLKTGSETCAAASEATSVYVPSSLDTAPFIYPLGSDSGQVPIALLEYLQDLPAVSAQFHGDALTACAPLLPGNAPNSPVPQSTGPPSSSLYSTATASSAQAPSPLSPSSSTASSSAQTTSSAFSTPIASSAQPPQPVTGNSTAASTPSSPSVESSALPFSESPSPSPTVRISPGTSPHHPNTEMGTTTTSPEPETLSPPAHPTPTLSGIQTPENDHSTAYVISTITGRAIVTTIPGDGQATRPGGGFTPAFPPTQHPTTPKTPGGGGGGDKPSPPATTPDNGKSPGDVKTPSAPDVPTVGAGGGNHGTTPAVPAATTKNPTNNPVGDPAQRQTVYHLPTTALTANTAGGIVYDGHTLQPGQTLTVGDGGKPGASATLISLHTAPSATQLVVNGRTYNPSTPTKLPNSSPDGESYEAVVTANGHTLTVLQTGPSLTIEDGPPGHSHTVVPTTALPVVFEGQTLSLLPSASASGRAVVINGGSTARLTAVAAPSPTATVGFGDGGTRVVFTVPNGDVVTAIQLPGATGKVLLEDRETTVTVPDAATANFAGVRVVVGSDGGVVVLGGAGGVTRTETLVVPTASASVTSVTTGGGDGDVARGGKPGRGGDGTGTHGTTESGASASRELLRSAVLVLALALGVVVVL